MNEQSHEARNEHRTEHQSGRIVVALDASSYSLAALRAAADLASLLDTELEGLFIEDINLVYLCGFPFSQEIGSYTATARRLENITIERQLRTQATIIHQSMNRVVLKTPV